MVVELLISMIFGVWFVATGIAQFKNPVGDFLRRYDYLHLIPRWTFFAPNPETNNYYLLYRNVIPEGTYTDFQEVILHQPRVWRAFWNPSRRASKVLLDCIHTLVILQTQANSSLSLQRTVPYLLLVNYVQNLQHRRDAHAAQFAICSIGAGDSKPILRILSHLIKFK